MNKQFLLLVFGLNLHAVTAYRTGLVTAACESMTPNHSNNNASVLEPPYRVTTDVSNYADGQVITVTLQANQTGFKGFLLQARNEKGPVGTFTITGSDPQLINCGINGSAVSHSSDVNKSTIVVQWTAPNTNNTDIHFRATFVQSFSIFWVGVQSDLVRFMATNTTVAPVQTTTHNSTSNSTMAPSQTTAHNSTSNSTMAPSQTTAHNPTSSHTTVAPIQTTTDNSSPSVSLTAHLLLLPLLAMNFIKAA